MLAGKRFDLGKVSTHVHFIKEVTATSWRDNSVDVFEYQKTWRHVSRLLKNVSNIPRPRRRLHIETGNTIPAALEQAMHQCFDADSFPISCRPMKDHTPLPRNSEILIDVLTIKELVHQICDRLLHVIVQDHILPPRFYNLIIQRPTHLPEAIIHIYVLIIRLLPLPHRSNQGVCNAIPGHYIFTLCWLFQDILQLGVAHLYYVHNEVLEAPFVVVFGKGTTIDELVGGTATAVACVKVPEALDRLVGDVEVSGCIAAGGELEKGD